jgi:hypothetical protein
MSKRRTVSDEEREREWLEEINMCDGAEVQKAAWPIVQRLVDRGLVRWEGGARGPANQWKRAVPADEEE